MAGERRTKLQLVAEACTEVGILTLVFGLFEALWSTKSGEAAPSTSWEVTVGLVSLLFFFTGMIIERIRPEGPSA